MIAEGKIIIDLVRRPDGVEPKVIISSNRRSDIGRVLCGRSPSEALKLLPVMFSVCGKAHLCAAGRAFRSLGHATGHAEGLGEELAEQGSQLVVLAENAREHLLRVILGWSDKCPELAKQLPVKQVMSLVADMTQTIGNNNEKAADAVRDQGARLAELLGGHLLSCSPVQWLQLETLGGLDDWLKTSELIAAHYLGEIVKNNWQSVGAGAVDYLPRPGMRELRDKMHHGDVEQFISQPDWHGVPRETGPLARWHNHPLVSAIIEEFGTGLLARNVARLVELAAIPQAITDLANDMSAQSGDKYRCERQAVAGIGSVETARGWLVHSVKMQDNIIQDYRILAPTEWNFHPRGSAAKGLEALANVSGTDLYQNALMLVEAIDPCVTFEVRIA